MTEQSSTGDNSSPGIRSPELMNADDTVLLLVDVQEKLAGVIPDSDVVIWNIARLLEGAAALGVSVVASEQYPKGLGKTVTELQEKLPADQQLFEKLEFSCLANSAIREKITEIGRPKVLLVGIETHVCILQTAFDLMSDGYRVYVPVDAVSSRNEVDYDTALERMDSAGATLTTAEATHFALGFLLVFFPIGMRQLG